MSEASKTPEVVALLRERPAIWDDWNSADFHAMETLARSLELRLTEALDLAQRASEDYVRAREFIEQQSSKIAELEKDAARLDWWGGDIRNAIDKAMAEGKPARAIFASSGQGGE